MSENKCHFNLKNNIPFYSDTFKLSELRRFLRDWCCMHNAWANCNHVHIKSSPKPVATKHVEGFPHVLQAPERWLQFYRQLACSIADHAFLLNETILSTHTILLRLASNILTAHLALKMLVVCLILCSDPRACLFYQCIVY